MYYIKLLSILTVICFSGVTPILILAFLNEVIDPTACWANDHASIMPYLSGASVAFGIMVGDRMLKTFIK
tara:strand:+ start:273 stop:482 length:210 start_codon:yes stop_codon:yes gene_type:complete